MGLFCEGTVQHLDGVQQTVLYSVSNHSLKGGTHITIIGLILLRFYPFMTTEDYLLSYKNILYDYPVVCGVLRVNLSR